MKSRHACNGFCFFDFLAMYGDFQVKFLKKAKTFTWKFPWYAKKKNEKCVLRFHISEDADQIWGQLDYLVTEIFEEKKKGKICKQIRRFSYTIRRNRLKMTQLRRIIFQQALGVERQVEPILERRWAGLQHVKMRENIFIDPETPLALPYNFVSI